MNLNEEVELAEVYRSWPRSSARPKAEAAGLHQRAGELRRGQEICHQGDPGDAMFHHPWAAGRRADRLRQGPLIRVAEMTKNDFVGEIAILCDVPRTATIKARESLSTLQDLSKDTFFAWWRRYRRWRSARSCASSPIAWRTPTRLLQRGHGQASGLTDIGLTIE